MQPRPPLPPSRRRGFGLALGLLLALAFLGGIAAVGTGAFGRQVRPAGQPLRHWLVALTHADYRQRDAAEAALQHLGPEAIPELERAVRSRPHLLARLLARLRGSGTPEGAGRTLVLDSPARLREQAARLLGKMGEAAQPAARTLGRQLGDPDPGVQRAAAWALRQIGPPAVPELVKALNHRQPPVRAGAAEVLGDRPAFGAALDLARTPLLAALRDPATDVRTAAAGSLGRGSFRADAEMVAALAGAANDAEGPVRFAAVRALGELGPGARKAAPALTTRLDDVEPRVRLEAARALWRVTGERSPAIPHLVTHLQNPEVHWQAALALAEIGPDAAEAVPPLLAKLPTELAHRPSRTPPSAALALARLGPTAVPGLTALLEHPSAAVRVAAAHALAGHGRHAAPAVPGLVRALEAHDHELRIVAAQTLAAIGPEAAAARPVLARLATEPDEYLRAAAQTALRQLEPSPP